MKKSYTLFLISLFLLSNTIASFAYSTDETIVTDTHSDFITVNNLDPNEVGIQTNNLKNQLLSRTIQFKHQSKTKSIDLQTLGIQVNILSTPQEIMNSNKLSNLIGSLITNNNNLKVNYSLSAKPESIESNILSALNLNTQNQDTNIYFNGTEFTYDELPTTYSITNKEEVYNQIKTLNLENNSIYLNIQEDNHQEIKQKLNQHIEKLNQFQNYEQVFEIGEETLTSNITKHDIEISNNRLSLKESSYLKLKDTLAKYETQKQDLKLLSLNDNNTLNTEGHYQDGIKINYDLLKEDIQNSLSTNNVIKIETEIDKAEIINQIDNKIYNYLGEGRSNFTGSDNGRIHNVKFASDNRYKAFLIPQGEEFSFNSILGRVVNSNGWKNAYIIQGGNIVPAPGGGICQMSTTIYRAALNTGLEISQQYNHSLYVNYYTAYGDGLDATIYPGHKDLKFINNTPSDLVLYSYYDDENNLYVKVFGQDDGREVSVNGPYYAGDNDTNPFNLTTRTNQINWVRQVKMPNQEETQEVLTSTYSKFYKR